MPSHSLTIALAGNPNSGKTTIFNAITGTRQKVGNWPGVTVEKKEGLIHRFGHDLTIIDLPGTYSLTPYSIEEIVARDYILEGNPDVVIDIIDASNLERSLYLATQLRELGCKIIFALNMADLAQSRGLKINVDKLSELLDVKVVFTVGNRNEGINELIKIAIDLAHSDYRPIPSRQVKYNRDIEHSIEILTNLITTRLDTPSSYNDRWTAIKLIEDDAVIKRHILAKTGEKSQQIFEEARAQRAYLFNRFDDEPEILTTDERYGFITGIIKEVVKTSPQQRIDISRNIDLVLTNRFIGLPIFFIFIWAMFQLTFTLGQYPMDWIDFGVTALSQTLTNILPDSLIKDLLIDGILAGLGSVIVFLPNILILFFCIALFEDTGYMSRAAFLMDKVMHLIGLHGKSFIPMLMGFGCNVPAIMASRTLESKKDRILTILITPFMSCSAKLPVYIILAGAFFGANAGSVIFGIYLVGIVLSIITGRLFRSTLLRGEDAPFVMELPPYRAPMAKSLMIHMWDRSKIFLRKMSGVILVGSVVIWCLSAFPHSLEYKKEYQAKKTTLMAQYQSRFDSASSEKERISLETKLKSALSGLNREKEVDHISQSYMGRIGKVIAPFFAPIGIDWRGGVALLTGFVAKEIVVSTLGVLYAAGGASEETALQLALRNSEMTPLAALAMMVFVLLYLPCLATVTAIRKETGSIKWMFFSIGYSTSMAWVAAFLVYQIGRFLGLG
jgi:ferrous iron transport protein B